MLNKKTLFIATISFLSLSFGVSAQNAALRDLNLAIEAVDAQQVDSAFFYLNRWSDSYGAEYSVWVYSQVVTNSSLRRLHDDARWIPFVERTRAQKHAAEDARPIRYPRKADTETTTVVPRVVSYDLTADISVSDRMVNVGGTMVVDFAGSDSIALVLNGNSDIRRIEWRRGAMEYTFNREASSPSQYMPDGRPIVIRRPRRSRDLCTIELSYKLDMSRFSSWATSFDDNWIELGLYAAWFPTVADSKLFEHSDITISIDDGWVVSGSGIVTETDGKWRMSQPWQAFDNVILASPELHSRSCRFGDSIFEVVYTDFPEADIDSVFDEVKRVTDLFTDIYGPLTGGGEYMKFCLSDSGSSGGYSRRNYISFAADSFGESLVCGIAHEAGHFWWNKASTASWQDWLNEAFAEYGRLIYVRHAYGESVYADYLDAYRENTRRHCPIWEVDRSAPEAYTALYEKGALLLNDWSTRIGQERFADFLKAVYKADIATTAAFLDFTESYLDHNERVWVEERLKN